LAQIAARRFAIDRLRGAHARPLRRGAPPPHESGRRLRRAVRRMAAVPRGHAGRARGRARRRRAAAGAAAAPPLPRAPRRRRGPAAVQATMVSLAAQVYDNWEVHRADTADARNAAMAASAAAFVGAIRAGDQLSPVALLRAAEASAADEEVDVLYTDEDVWSADGEPAAPRFKPDWSPELLRACMYMGRLLFVRRALAIAADGYRASMDGALDYDLALRVCPHARRIAHVSEVLYHR